MKDLIRFLKREDDTLDIRRQLGHTQILQNDLIPILKQYNSDTNLFETVLRYFVLQERKGSVLFNDALNTFYLQLYGRKEGRKCFI